MFEKPLILSGLHPSQIDVTNITTQAGVHSKILCKIKLVCVEPQGQWCLGGLLSYGCNTVIKLDHLPLQQFFVKLCLYSDYLSLLRKEKKKLKKIPLINTGFLPRYRFRTGIHYQILRSKIIDLISIVKLTKAEPLNNKISLITNKLHWSQQRANDNIYILSSVNKNVLPLKTEAIFEN